MNTKTSMLVAALALSTLAAVSGCKKETLGDKVDDAMDNRPAEKVQDAAEDVKDAVKDATN